MQITEPTTMLTDYGLTVLCSLFARWLWKAGQEPDRRSVCSWALGFVSLGVAASAGGTVHGFSLVIGETFLWVLWMVTLYGVGLASCWFLIGTIEAVIAMPMRRLLRPIPVLQFVVYALWAPAHNDFRVAVWDYAGGLFIVLVLHIYAWFAHKTPSAPWIVSGVLVTFVGSAIQQSGLVLHPSFNHNDLYHVIQMASLTLLYRGASLLSDRGISDAARLSLIRNR